MLFLIGAIAGFAYGFSAFGGSLLGVALLTLLAPYAITDAMAMNFCMLLVMATITAGDGVRARLPVPGLIWPFVLFAVVAAPLGVWVSALMPVALIDGLFPFVLVAAALVSVLLVQRLAPVIAWPRGGLAALTPDKTEEQSTAEFKWTLPVLGGGIGGLFAGLFGASGALFLVPTFGRLFGKRPGQAVACAEMAMLPVLLAAVTASLLLGRAVEWRATGLMIFGALAGLSLARMLTPKFGAKACHAVVAAMLVLTAVMYWFG